MYYLHAQLQFFKIVLIVFRETKSACVSGRPVCPESEAEVLFNVI